jgi:hypothetical protein
MSIGLAACSWILGIGEFSPETDRDASFVGSSMDAYGSRDSQEREAQPGAPSVIKSDAGLDVEMVGTPDSAEASRDRSEPPPDTEVPDSTAAPDTNAAPDAPPPDASPDEEPPDAEPEDVTSVTPCERLLQCCTGLILPAQLATACFAASLADAGALCIDGLALLGDGGFCL